MLEDGLLIIVKEDIQLITHSEPCCMNLISSSIELPADGIIPTNFVRVDRHNFCNAANGYQPLKKLHFGLGYQQVSLNHLT